MSSLEKFAALQAAIQATLPALNEVVRYHLNSDVWLIRQISEYLIAGGGKRLRPLMHVWCAKACGYNQDGYKNDETLILGAVLELIHTATLLHDDVVDHSELRRGKLTANAAFGNAASVLSGDFLYSRAFQMMVGLKRMMIMDILSSATNIIAEGEVLQLMYAGEARITEFQYRQMIEAKTAKLFEAAAELGAVLAGREEWRVALAGYGRHVGVAFQLIDDMLDYSSDASEIGKNVGDDLEEGKWTLPLLLAFDRSNSTLQNHLEALVQTKDRSNLPELLKIFAETGALQATEAAARHESKQAIAALEILPPSHYKELLIELAHFAVQRNT